jgi:hypothetical protein
MTTIQRICASMAAALLLAGCGSGADESARTEPPPVEDTAFGDMVGTMDKARAVQDTTLRHKADMDRALQESEGAAE